MATAELDDIRPAAEVKREPKINVLFRTVMKFEASDLHLKVGLPPMMRLKGVIRKMDAPPISEEQMERLYAATREVLTDAVTRSVGQRAAELKGEKRSGLRVHARTGLPCPVCGDTVREVSFADSSLQYCPTCQTGGKPLADRRLSRLVR